MSDRRNEHYANLLSNIGNANQIRPYSYRQVPLVVAALELYHQTHNGPTHPQITRAVVALALSDATIQRALECAQEVSPVFQMWLGGRIEEVLAAQNNGRPAYPPNPNTRSLQRRNANIRHKDAQGGNGGDEVVKKYGKDRREGGNGGGAGGTSMAGAV